MADDKKPVAAPEDMAVNDMGQETRNDTSGDVEMGDAAKDSKDDKKDDEKVEDPVITTSNGMASPFPTHWRWIASG
jgi:hypothetical protein